MAQADQLDIDATGRCDCGAVVVTARGSVLSMFLCSCENCQRVSGGGHSSVALLQTDALKVQGDTRSYARPSASGAIFTRHFCPICGTTVRAESARAAALSILPAGLFAGQNVWFVPNQLIFARSKPAWDLIADHLPLHQGYRSASP